jgi:hypothetical protein
VVKKKTKKSVTKKKKQTVITKKKEKKEQFLKICPKCASIKIFEEIENPLHSLGVLAYYRCSHCDYSSHLFPEVKPSQIDYFKNHVFHEINLKDGNYNELIDTSYGRFEVNYLWKATGPIFLIIGIILLLNSILLPGTLMLIYALFTIIITYHIGE